MKTKLLLLFLLTISIISCDGRKRTKQILDNSVSKFKEVAPQIDFKIYHPKVYAEVVTDTLLTNDMHINIKNHTLMNEQIFISEIIDKNKIKKAKYHRKFQSEIKIYKNSIPIVKMIINAKDFKLNTKDLFWNNATLEHAWVNKNTSTSELIYIDFSFINPVNQCHKFYRMEVDKNGNQNIYLLEEHV
ncbi:hypothetical protein D7030_03430 [Flavobacteriaceae bacterium AU392]|nr:hypothetical protein D1817_09905 [Flavobacteriaceae bacterium]RKM85730.1 hypothetical protein D7030_03430 [Flavobacteriaceae bacterium AU392]